MVKQQIQRCTFVFRCLFICAAVCLCVRESSERERRKRAGGWPNQQGRDQKVNLHIWPQEQLQAEDDKLHTVTAHSQSGCYTCHANPVQICTGLAFIVMFKVYVCLCVRLYWGGWIYSTLGQNCHPSKQWAVSQVFSICFLPLFITVILKEACVRDHCPIGLEMLEYFSSPQGSCDSFIYSLSGMHGEAIQSFQECWDPGTFKTQFGRARLPQAKLL